MPTKNHHVILRSRIEVTVDKHNQNSILQQTIHKVIQKRIIPILSKLLSKYVPHDVVIHLDKLIIDGGSFHLSTLDKQLPYQVEQVLMVQLQEQIKKVIQNPAVHQIIPLPDAKREALAHYLSEGNFAWWMSENSENQIEKIYLALLHHTPLLIEQLWYNLNKKEKAVQRCMTLFSHTTLEHTLSCLLKQPITYFRPILAETGLLLHQTKVLTNLSYPPKQQLLAMALLGIITQQKTKIDQMGLLSILLKQVALQTSTHYDTVLEKLHAHYAQNEGKASCHTTTKALLLQLRDLVITPPKLWYQDLKNQENVLKELDKIGNGRVEDHQLSAVMHRIGVAMDQAGIRPLVKSWLQEEKNRTKLAKHLPDALFAPFLASIDPSIIAIFSDFAQIATVTTATNAPACVIKTNTLAYCAFRHSKTDYLKEMKSLFRKYIANNIISKEQLATLLATQPYHPVIKSTLIPLTSRFAKKTLRHRPPSTYLPDVAASKMPIHQPTIQHSPAQPILLSTELLNRLEKLIIRLLEPTPCQISVDAVKNILVQAAIADPLSTEKKYIDRVIDYLTPYAPFAADILGATEGYQQLAACFSSMAPLQTNHEITQLGGDSENPLSDVVDFLAYNELPTGQLVPAYFIAKCLGKATCQAIRDQLVPLCQEPTILKKLMQHATEAALSKLLQAFTTFPQQILDGLEQVIIQSGVFQGTQQQDNIRLLKEIFITAAIIHRPSEQQYIECIVLHLSRATASNPTILCEQLIDAAKQSSDHHLAEAFSLIKEKLAPLNLDEIDETDLIFLSTHETFTLDKGLLPLYYSSLLPAIKHMVRQSLDLSQSAIDQLVAQHLPTIPPPLQETISFACYKQLTNVIQSKQERVAQRWHLFLHTGKLGDYLDSKALLEDVITHLPTFALAQDKIHVRQRLITNFTHTQLMLLVQHHSEAGKSLASCIQGSYQLWCATQGSLSQFNTAKQLFWNSVLKTLPQTSMDQDHWLAQFITELSNMVEITPTTLLETFQLVETKPKEISTSLHKLQDKYRQEIQRQAIQRGYKAATLAKLYLLLNSNLSLFTQEYHLSMATLGNELVRFMADQPSAVSKLLEEQDNPQLVARRLVHYFSQEVARKIIACLAKEQSQFVMHYLDLLTDPLAHIAIQPDPSSTWNKELYIATIDYFITQQPFAATKFIHSTLVTTRYPKEAMYKILSSIVATKATNQDRDKIITLLKPLVQHINQPTMPQQVSVNHPLASPLATKQQAPLPKVSPLEKEVRVYTKNSGLVFLWPFLYDFFKGHHLMVGNQFFCDQAAHNAVYLLQYLVTGKLKSPEWQLTLPKLLCGLSYDEVLLPYTPIDADCDTYDQEALETTGRASAKQPKQPPTEQTAADASISSSAIEAIDLNNQLFMDKVIKRWKSLTKLKEIALYQNCTTQDILQSYFLNRLGILTRQEANDATESKFWHLTIMYQDDDTDNVLPPWSMTNIKLPWMQEAMIVFWMPG